VTSKYARKVHDQQGDVLHLKEFPEEGTMGYRNAITCKAIRIDQLWDYTDPLTRQVINMEPGDYLVKPSTAAPVHAARGNIFENVWEPIPTDYELVERLLSTFPVIVMNAIRKYRFENPGSWQGLLQAENMTDPFMRDGPPGEVPS
jgi:hypothetical protein